MQARPGRVICSVLKDIKPPAPFVVVAQGWPSSLITVSSLKLRLDRAFFPAQFHTLFKKNKPTVTGWNVGSEFDPKSFANAVFLVSGSYEFVDRILQLGDFASQCIVHVEIPRRGRSKKSFTWIWREAAEVLRKHSLVSSRWKDELCGGATDAEFIFGFGNDLGSAFKPAPIPSVVRVLGNYICPTAGGFNLEIVEQCYVPSEDELPIRRRPMWHDNTLLPQGLFACQYPQAKVYCKSVYHPGSFAKRALTTEELLRLYQLPLEMDKPILEMAVRWTGGVPFEHTPPPEMYASMFRQLWSSEMRGGSSGLHSGMDNSGIRTEPRIGGVVVKDLSNTGCSAIDSQNQSIEALGRLEKGGGEDDGVEEESDSPTPACVGITPVNLTLVATAVQGDVERDIEDTKASDTSRLSLSTQGISKTSADRLRCSNKRVMTAQPSVPENTLDNQASIAESCDSSQTDSCPSLGTRSASSSSCKSLRAGLSHQLEGSTIEPLTLPTVRASVSLTQDTSRDLQWENLLERKSSGSAGEESDTSIAGSGVWKFEFEEGLAPCDGVPNRMEEMAETLSTLEEPSTFDSAETMATGSPRTNPNDPAPAYGDGPPFATGDIVVVQLDDNVTLMRAFVCEANHPWYCLQFPDSKLVRVNANEVAMFPKSSKFNFDETDEMKQLRRDMAGESKLGSFGVQMDSQLHSLRRIKDEKQYAKAVKSDDAEVPVYLWNERVDIPGFTPAKRDKVLEKLRKIGHRLFLRALRRDCHSFLVEKHGVEWQAKPRQDEKGRPTELGRDQQAVCSALWHAAHTNWFEYKCGSRLVHFRFPI